MDIQQVREWTDYLKTKRESLVQLLDRPNLGTLRVDVNQALEELDDLLEEFKKTFPALAE